MDVAIIGAGWAGATAAKNLINTGTTNIIKVLEVRDYAGGRSRTVMESVWEGEKDYPMDIGSQWIHGISGNPIEQIAPVNAIFYRLSESLQIMIYKEGGAISNDDVSSLEGELFSGSDGFIPYQVVLQESTEIDQSLQTVADQFITNKSDITFYKRNVLNFFLHSRIGQESSGSLDDLCLWWWDSEEEFEGVDAFLHGGFSELFHAYAKGAVQDVIETESSYNH